MALVNEDFKAVVGKTIFSDGKGKLFFGYYKEDDSVHFVDYKTWKKLSFKDVSKGNTNKERVIKAILKNQKQFNKKVDFNMWAKKNNPSFEQTMDWFIQNGWISNINKGGIKESVDILSVTEGKKVFRVNPGIGKVKYSISSHDGVKKHKDGSDFFDIETFKNKVDLEKAIKKYTSQGFKMESVNEIQYKDAVAKFNDELIKHPMVKKAAQHYKKTPAEIVKVLQQRLSTKGNRGGDTKEVSINFKDTTSGITIKHSKKFNESVNESAGKEAMGIAAFTGTRGDAVQKFIDTHKINAGKLFNFVKKGKLSDRMEFVTALAGNPGNPVQKKIIKMFGESVTEDTKKRFDVDFYKGNGDRQTSHEEIIRGDKFSDVVSQATKVAKSKGMNYVEFYYKDAFIGSIDKKSNYTFKKGRHSEKSPLSVTEAKFGYKDSTASYIKNHNNEYKVAEKINKGNEVKFYDELQKMEDKIGHPKFMIFVSNALRGYGVDMYKDPKIKNPQDAQEALFLLSK